MTPWRDLTSYWFVVVPSAAVLVLGLTALRTVWKAARRQHVWARLQAAFPEIPIGPMASMAPGGILGIHWSGGPGEPTDTVLVGMSTPVWFDALAVHVNPSNREDSSSTAPSLSIPWTTLKPESADRFRLLVAGEDRGWVRFNGSARSFLPAGFAETP